MFRQTPEPCLRCTFTYQPDIADGDRAFGEHNPSLHVFLTHSFGANPQALVIESDTLKNSRNTCTVQIRYDVQRMYSVFHARQRLTRDDPGFLSSFGADGSIIVPMSLSLVVNVYVDTENEHGQKCSAHAGAVHVPLAALLQASSTHLVMQHTSDPPICKGKLQFRDAELIGDHPPLRFSTDARECMFYIDDGSQSSQMSLSKEQLAANVQHSLDFFASGIMANPKPRYLSRIHCPYYSTPVGVIPGSAYLLLVPQHPTDAAFFREVFTVALRRRNTTAEYVRGILERQNASPQQLVPDFLLALEVLATALATYATAFIYLKDFVNTSSSQRRKRGKVIVVEDYKTARSVRADDCDGAADEVHIEFHEFQRARISGKDAVSRMLRAYQRFLGRSPYTLVVPIAAATASHQAIDSAGMSAEEVEAHVFASLVPTDLFLRHLDTSEIDLECSSFQTFMKRGRPCDADLPVLVCEGTCRTTPLLRPFSAYYPPEQMDQVERRVDAMSKARKAIYLDPDMPKVVMFEVPNYHTRETDSDYSPFYKAIGTAYSDVCSADRVLDFAFTSGANAGVSFNEFVTGDWARNRVVPFNQYTEQAARLVEDTLAQLEPVPPITTKGKTPVVPVQLQALARIGPIRPENHTPGVLPIPTNLLTLTLRSGDATEDHVHLVATTIFRHRELLQGAEVSAHYLADAPFAATTVSKLPSVLYEIRLQVKT